MAARHINIMSTTLRILLAIGIATSLARGAPLGSAPRSRQLQPWLQQGALQWALDHTRGPDDSCHLFVATGPDAADADSNLVEDANLVAGNGIVFAVQSDEGDGDGVAVRVTDAMLVFLLCTLDNSNDAYHMRISALCRSPASDFTWISRRWRSSRR